jgi:hypothetical protein
MTGGGDAYTATFTHDTSPTYDGSGLPRDDRPIELFVRDTDQRFAREDLLDLETLGADAALRALGELELENY